ncbi:AIPR family protein [Alteromonas sp. OM2203]|uniref:AIPR family protein n=1 Tax=Alteromonas sp. OM2203 TaxID=3398817 RepID=UPI003AF3ECFD
MSTLTLNRQAAPENSKTVLEFHSLRNISSPDDTANDRKVLTGHMPILEVLKLNTHANVRSYLLDVEGKKKKVRTAVHRAIENTLENNPDKFSVLNGGVTIVAENYDINEKKRQLTLNEASIINGAQTQGIIKDYFEGLKDQSDFPDAHITFELIITTDENLVAEISIARNFQNDVKLLSISGKLGIFTELEKSISSGLDGQKLRTSETDSTEDHMDTEKLLQVMTALIPEELWQGTGRGDTANKNYAYNQKAKCLKEFTELKKKVDSGNATDEQNELYQYFIDIAPSAWKLYEEWKAHPKFVGTRMRSIVRDGREIVEVPDGVIFPILAAISMFIEKIDGKWQLNIPDIFEPQDLVSAASSAYKDVANHKPYVMGRSKASYSSLIQVTSIYKRLMQKR